MTCVHHWVLETPNGTPAVGAVCKKCGAEKLMRASCEFDVAPQGDWKAIKERTWEARLRSDKAKEAPKPRRPKRPMVHGTRYAYMRLKCRCEACKAWNRAYVRERYWKAKGMEPPAEMRRRVA